MHWSPGATTDNTLFRNNLDFHRHALKKSSTALAVTDHEEMSQKYPDLHAAILDKLQARISVHWK